MDEHAHILILENEHHQIRTAELEWVILGQDERIEELTEDVQELQTQLEETNSNLAGTQNELNETIHNLAGTQNELNETKHNLAGTQYELNKTKHNLAETQTELNETKNNLAGTQNELNETKHNLSGTQKELNETKNSLAGTQNELNETRNNLVGTQTELKETQYKLVITGAKLTKMESDLVVTRTKHTKTQSEHEETKNKLKKLKSALHTGQIAFDFEKDLATYIYPHDKKFGSRKIFTNMKRWLVEKKDTPQGREANEKWKALQEEFSWSSEHEDVFFKLLESRKEIAHPTIDRDLVQSQISEDFNDEEKMYVKDIIDIIERVNELI